jgi:hypothetical protein
MNPRSNPRASCETRSSRRRKLGDALAVACLAVGDRTAAGDGDDRTSTVAGFISNASAAKRAPAPRRTLFAGLFDFLSPVGTAEAGRSGVRVTVAGDADSAESTDAFGFFVVQTANGGSLAVTFESGGASFSRTVFVPRGGAVHLAGVSLDGGAASSATTFFAARGDIRGANCGTRPRTLTLETPDVVTVALTDDAEIVTSEGITCGALNDSIGDSVFVNGSESDDGGVVVSWVTGGGIVPGGLVEFRGRVTSVDCSTSANVTRDDGESILVDLRGAGYDRGFDSCDDLGSGTEVQLIGDPRSEEVAAVLVFPG